MTTPYSPESYLPPTAEELSTLVGRSLQTLRGHRLQEVELSPQMLALGFFGGGPLKWLVMDLRPKSAGLFLLSADQRPHHKPEKKPLVLFLNSHARDHRLIAIEHQAELGRVVDLYFHHAEGLEVRLILIPSQLNVRVSVGKRSLSLNKPREVEASAHHAYMRKGLARTADELTAQWLNSLAHSVATRGPAHAPAKDLSEVLKKKRRAISKVEDELLRKSCVLYRKLGDFLVQNQTMNVPETLRSLLVPDKTLSENIEAAYSKAKELEHKQARTQVRLKQLKDELEALEGNPASLANEIAALSSAKKKPTSSDKVTYRARTLRLSEQLEFQIGKSAKDNLSLLRQSRSWDLWLHIKDQPSSHGILFRPKNKPITDDQLRSAALFLLRATKAGAAEKMKGEKVEFLIAECRYVRPIKGDKLGRVTHHNARTLSVRVS